MRFLTSPRTGRLASVTGLPKAGPGVPFVRWRAPIRGLVHAPGANVHRLGSFVFTGTNAAEVEERADTLRRQVRIHVEPLHEAGPAQVRSASTALIAE